MWQCKIPSYTHDFMDSHRENPMSTNTLFEEISVGQSASLSTVLTQEILDAFVKVSGDCNPAHTDPVYAASTPLKAVVGHGVWTASIISRILGTTFPGPGTIYLGQTLKFKRPVYLGDEITGTVTVTQKDEKGKVWLQTIVVNQRGEAVLEGEAIILAPTSRYDLPG